MCHSSVQRLVVGNAEQVNPFKQETSDLASLGSTSQVAAGHLDDHGCACDFGFDLKNIEGW